MIFAEFLSDDGGKLFLFEPNRVFQVNENEIDEEEFIWVSIDDEDNMEVMGCWQESPFFNFDISTQMSIIVDDKSKVENLIESFDYSEDEDDEEINFFKDTGFDCSNSTKTTFIGVFEPDLKALIKYKSIIEDITEDLKQLGDEVFASSTFDTYNYELIETLAEKETKKAGSGFDVGITGFSSSVVLNKAALLIKKTTGMGLKETKELLAKYARFPGFYDDHFLSIQRNIVKSDATDFKAKLEETGVQVKIVASKKATEPYINVEVDELISHPSINAYGFSGSGANGWNGELELDKKGVSLVSLKS